MEIKDFSGFPMLSLTLYFNRAIEDKHWLEAIVLAHMYIETQLRMILGFDDFRKTPRAKKEETVYSLNRQAYKKKAIDKLLYERIDHFNSTRNNAVHNLTLGIISYEDLEPMANEAAKLIRELNDLETAIRSRRT
ncbi:MAG: hypothetical protein JW730_08755 [Anaerolineales bacterium]|nr:hypothetical protein [Anaerolineales bacterium]